jgi:hypothetical protein
LLEQLQPVAAALLLLLVLVLVVLVLPLPLLHLPRSCALLPPGA